MVETMNTPDTTRAAHECREEFEAWRKKQCGFPYGPPDPWLAWQASRTTLLADKALVEEMAKAIYLLQPETISRRRIEGTALHEDSLVIPFEEACNKDNAMQKAQAALDVIRRKVG